ncbi:MAG: hypothetical protein ACRDJE_17140 [Dehalococcoidia bacterium]
MTGNEKFGITETDARQLAEKLVAFEATLPPAERALFQALRRRTPGTDEDVDGHFFGFDPFLNIVIDIVDGANGGSRWSGSAAKAWGAAQTQTRVHGTRPTHVAPPARPANR